MEEFHATSDFAARVKRVIATIPPGRVASYGQVASLAGSPGAARQVGFVLRTSLPSELPWWRVINASGHISIKGNWAASKQQQKELLLSEEVEVNEFFQVDMQRYRFEP